MDAIQHPPAPINEPVKGYAPGSPERARLLATVSRVSGDVNDLPCIVDGKLVRSGDTVNVTMPCAHRNVLGHAHLATPETVQAAIDGAVRIQPEWAALPWTERAAVFLRAAELLAGPWRDRMNATTMVGQGKTPHQAEIDAACEMIDFFRFNAAFARRIYEEQPISSPGVWNRADHRPLEGFVFAVTPFNFTSIAANLCTAPALMGNTVVWKPSLTQALSAECIMELLRASGLPDGVIQMVHGHGPDVGDVVLKSPHLAGLHFTGSTPTFRALWRGIANNLESYRSYPRIVGETGGKDFIIAHPSADVQALAVAIVRGGYEYQGQKCSACSRIYIPRSLWAPVRDAVASMVGEMKVGDVREFDTFVGAVIDERAFRKHAHAVELARGQKVIVGGTADASVGWYVQPTLVQVDDPRHTLMTEEWFGPIVSAFVYEDERWEEALALVDSSTPYALTGAVFATDRRAVNQALVGLRNAAGNFYINDKPTGAVVGQQPFGGARASGTNDKAGAAQNLLRWVSPRSIKETFVPPTDWRYPYLG